MISRRLMTLLLVPVLFGCRKEAALQPPPPKPQPSASVDTLLNQNPASPAAAPDVPSAAPVPETPAATATGFAGDPVGGQFSLPREARNKRNLEWLKILKSGTAQQQQQVQEQMTKLSSDELHEITVLYQSQQK